GPSAAGSGVGLGARPGGGGGGRTHEALRPRGPRLAAVGLRRQPAAAAAARRSRRFRGAVRASSLPARDGRHGLARHRRAAMSARLALWLAASALLLVGCASFSPDGGMGDVASVVGRETGKDVVKLASAEDTQRARERVAALLGEPLSADQAVQIALLSNRDLQAAYNDLGISEAAYVQASLPKNPGLSFMLYGGTGVTNFEVRLIENILELATLPARTKIAAEHYAHAKHVAIVTTLSLAADVRRAWVRTVAAERQGRLLRQPRAPPHGAG